MVEVPESNASAPKTLSLADHLRLAYKMQGGKPLFGVGIALGAVGAVATSELIRFAINEYKKKAGR